ncbi:MAG: sulfurtransferase [Flavobacterium sp.]|nr:sulfurtransferase [Flavobacterium sp.]
MNATKLFSSLLIIILFVSNTFAQDLITAKEFIALQKEKPNLVIVDASKDKLYAQSHIEGAINIPYTILNEKDPKIDGTMLPLEDVAKILGNKGISNEDSIVVYDEGTQKYATLVYWIFKYLGAKDVKVLHKEMNAFRDARIKLTSEVPTVKTKTFNVNLVPEINADAAYVESVIGNPDVIIIDARTPDEFNGVRNEKSTYSNGHIKGAINIPYESLVKTGTNDFISPEEFKKVAAIELSPEKTYLLYCKTGIKGATLYTYMVNVLGFKNVKNYKGAYAEWDYLGKLSLK